MAFLHRVPAPLIPAPGQPLDPSFIANYGKPAGLWMPSQAGGTTAYDFSGKGNNGTLTGGVSLVPGSGQFPAAWKFIAASFQYIALSSPPITSYPFTFVSVFNPNSFSGTDADILISVGTTTSLGDAWGISVNSSKFFIIFSRAGGATSSAIVSSALTAGKTYIGIGSCLSSTSRTAYIFDSNAALIGSNTDTASSSPASITSGIIGRAPISWSSFQDYWDGNIYFSAAFKTALSQGQAQSLASTLMYGVPFAFMQPRTLWLPTGAGAAPIPQSMYSLFFGGGY